SAYRSPTPTAQASAGNRLRPPDRSPGAGTCGRPSYGNNVLAAGWDRPSPLPCADSIRASPPAPRAGRGLGWRAWHRRDVAPWSSRWPQLAAGLSPAPFHWPILYRWDYFRRCSTIQFRQDGFTTTIKWTIFFSNIFFISDE